MKKTRVKLGSNSYDICVGSGLLTEVGQQLKSLEFSGRLVAITDSTVNSLHGETLKESLISEGFEVIILELPAGEEQKSLEIAGSLYHELSKYHAERTTPILALGGGVIGDLAGFVAATYMRGVPLIQIPTTLLAQVDSSIGGKVAVNHDQLKNKIGTFYQPRLVISDIITLRTLTNRDVSNGLAEVIKSAVIWDKKFFVFLEEILNKVESHDEASLEEIVLRTTKIKAEIVEKDEKDLGLRSILNYGHTIGHALESVSNFKLEHGSAVAIGMIAAGKISNRLGFLNKNDLTRLKRVITKAGLPTELPNLKMEEIIQAIKYDKKILQGKIRLVLPKTIGNVFITEQADLSLIEQVLTNWNEDA